MEGAQLGPSELILSPEKKFRRKRRQSVSAEVDRYDRNETGFRDVQAAKVALSSKDPQELRKIRECIQDHFLFSHLDQEQISLMMASMTEIQVQKETDIITQGTEGDFFYIIVSGIFDVFKIDDKYPGTEYPGKKVFQYEESGSFGELALMYNCPRAATVRARTDGKLWALDRSNFRRINISTQREKRHLYESFLQNVTILQNLTHAEREQVIDCVNEKSFSDGDLIIKQGARGEKFYLVIEGTAKAVKELPGGRSEILGIMNKGDYFGERALITNEPRACNVIAEGNLRVAVMDRQQFERLLGPCREIMKRRIRSYVNTCYS